MMRARRNTAAALATALTLLAGARLVAARAGMQDLPAKLTGTWALNRELSTGLAPSAPGRGRGGAPQRPLYAVAGVVAGQRGGGGGGGSRGGGGTFDAADLTPAQRAARAAMSQLQQVSERLTIKASPAEVTFVDGRGERTFAVNGKSATIDVGGSPIKVKSKWDKQVLKQEFSSPDATLTETWSIDGSDRLVLTAKYESLSLGPSGDRPSAVVTPDRRFVFDRH